MAAARVNWHGQDLPVVREVVKLGEVETSVEIAELAEPELRQIVALLATLDRFEVAARLAPTLLLERGAGLYVKHGGTRETWRAYTASLGVPQSKTRQPKSMFQPFLRWANGGKPDTTGRLAKLAAPLDEWVGFGDKRPSPIASEPGTSELAEWLDANGGYTNVAERRRDENYSESETANLSSLDTDVSGAQSRRFTRGGYLDLATTGSEEWYTPRAVFEALGCRFDLDVASPGAEVVPWIPADRHFTAEDNGLERDWGDAFVWCNAPFSRERLPQWMEKFRRHGNGIAMIGDRTSTGVWQDVCGNADLILFVNKKINFISPTSGPGNNTLGSTLIAYGERGVNALMNAAAAGLGTLFRPCPSVPTSGNTDLRSPQAAEAGEHEIRRVENYSESERYWLTPPDIYDQLNAEFHFDFDACPYPRPDNFNSLEVPWGQATYCNAPFSAKRNPGGHGPTDFARKAIAENQLDKTVVLPLPVFNYVDVLLRAGAEVRPLGRVLWLEATTGQPHPSPPFIACFILRGKPK